MQNILLVVHLIICVLMIAVILLQRSEGGALGIGGSGAGGGNLFSARGVGNSLTRATAILALCFFFTSVTLTVLALRGTGSSGSVFDNQPTTGEQAPAQPAPAPSGSGSALPDLGAPQTPPANN
jgi:preprotein translocase subunit SecG